MLERLVIWFVKAQLQRLLGSFTSNHDIQLQSGTLRLNHVVLSPAALAQLGLPLSVRSAKVRKLEVLLPWRQAAQRNAPFVLRLDGLTLVICSRLEAGEMPLPTARAHPSLSSGRAGRAREGRQYQEQREPFRREVEQQQLSREWLARRKAARLHKSQALAHVVQEASTEDNDSSNSAPPSRLDPSQQQALLDMILQSLVVSITNVSIRVEEGFGGAEDQSNAASHTAHGQHLWSAANKGRNSSHAALEVRLDSFSLRCRRDTRVSGLLGMLPIPSWMPWPRRNKRSREQTAAIEVDASISAFWQDGRPEMASASSGPTLATDALVGGEVARVPVISPCELKAAVDMSLLWPEHDENASGQDAMPVRSGPHLKLSGGAELSELSLSLPRAVLSSAMRVARRAVYAEYLERHRHLRPSRCVSHRTARAWWRYACAAVKQDLSEERRICAHTALRRQAALLVEYETLLQRSGWGTPLSIKEQPPPTDAQLELETQIDEASLLRARKRVIERGLAVGATVRPPRQAWFRGQASRWRVGKFESETDSDRARNGSNTAARENPDGSGLENLSMDVSLKVVARSISACMHLTDSSAQRDGTALTFHTGTITADLTHELRRSTGTGHVGRRPRSSRDHRVAPDSASRANPAVLEMIGAESSTATFLSASVHSLSIFFTGLNSQWQSRATSPRISPRRAREKHVHAQGSASSAPVCLVHLGSRCVAARSGGSLSDVFRNGNAAAGHSPTPACQITVGIDCSGVKIVGMSAGVCISQPLSMRLHLGIIQPLADFIAAIAPSPPPQPFSCTPSRRAQLMAQLEAVIDRLVIDQQEKCARRSENAYQGLDSIIGRKSARVHLQTSAPRSASPSKPVKLPAWLVGLQLDVTESISAVIITPGAPRLHTPVVQMPRLHVGVAAPAHASQDALRIWIHAGIAVSWAKQAVLLQASREAPTHNLPVSHAQPSVMALASQPTFISSTTQPRSSAAMPSLLSRQSQLGSCPGSPRPDIARTPDALRTNAVGTMWSTPVSWQASSARVGLDTLRGPHTDTVSLDDGGGRRSFVEAVTSFFTRDSARSVASGNISLGNLTGQGHLGLGASLANTFSFGGHMRHRPHGHVPPSFDHLPEAAELFTLSGVRPIMDSFMLSLSLALPEEYVYAPPMEDTLEPSLSHPTITAEQVKLRPCSPLEGSISPDPSSHDPFDDLDDGELDVWSSKAVHATPVSPVRNPSNTGLLVRVERISEGALADDDDDDVHAVVTAAVASAKLPTIEVNGALPTLRVHVGARMLSETIDLIEHARRAIIPMLLLYHEISQRAPANVSNAESCKVFGSPGEEVQDVPVVAERPTAPGAGVANLGLCQHARIRLQLQGLEVSVGLADRDEDERERDSGNDVESVSAPTAASLGERPVFAEEHSSLCLRSSALDLILQADAGGAQLSMYVGSVEVIDCRRGVPPKASVLVQLNSEAPPPVPIGLLAKIHGRCTSETRGDDLQDFVASGVCAPLLSASLQHGDEGSILADVGVQAQGFRLQWNPGVFSLCSYTLVEAMQVLAEAAADRAWADDAHFPSSRAAADCAGEMMPIEATTAAETKRDSASRLVDNTNRAQGPLRLDFSARVSVVSVAFNAEPLTGPVAGIPWDATTGETFEVAPEGMPPNIPMPHIMLLTVDDVEVALTQSPPIETGGKPELSLVIRASLDEMRCPENQRPDANTFVMARAIAKCPGTEAYRYEDVDVAATTVHAAKSNGAQAVVTLEQGVDTGGTLDVVVDIEPVYFELRIAPLLRSIEFIERAIRKPLVRLANGGRPVPPAPLADPASAIAAARRRPTWKILVPSAILTMPTSADGRLEFKCYDAMVASSSVGEPTLMDLIKVSVVRVHGVAVHPRGRGPPRHLALTVVEEIPRFELTLRKPLSNAAAASLGVPFQELIIDLTQFKSTVHLGLTPDDFGLLLAIWLDNFNLIPILPKDPARARLAQRGTTHLKVVVRLPQAALWLHDAADSRPLLQLRLDNLDIGVNKRLDGRTFVEIEVPKISCYVTIETTSGAIRWFRMLGPPLTSPAAAAEARGETALHAGSRVITNAARDKDGLGSGKIRPASQADAAARTTDDAGVFVSLATKGGDPEQVDVSIGRLSVSVLPKAVLGLAEFGVRAGVSASNVLSARKARLMARDGALPPRPPPTGQQLRLAIPMVQLLVTEPAPGAPEGMHCSADGSGDDDDEDGQEGPGALPMATPVAQEIEPRLVAVHISLSMESMRVPDGITVGVSLDTSAIETKPAQTAVYDQLSLQLSHSHTCLALGYYEDPIPDAWPRMPAMHGLRACGALCDLVSLPSVRDQAPALLEPFALHVAQSLRPGKKQTSLTLDQPLRASISLEMLIFVDAVSSAYQHTAATFPIDLTRPLDPLANAAAPAALGGGGKHLRALEMQETLLGSVPGVEITLLSCDRPCLPLVQLALGGEGQPITLTTDKVTTTAPLAAEVLVPMAVNFYNFSLLCWEPVVEPLSLLLRLQKSNDATPITSINLSLRGSLEINVSDTMIIAVHTNLQAFLGSRAARRALWLSSLPRGTWKSPRPTSLAVNDAHGHVLFEHDGGGQGALYWIVNETGEDLRYWATEEADVPMVPRGARTLDDEVVASRVASPSQAFPISRSNTRRVHELPAGGSARLSMWDAEAAELLSSRGWCEDTPRRLTVRLQGARPIAGLLVNRLGTTVLPIDEGGPSPSKQVRSLVCEVEQRNGTTRLTLRSMFTLVNCTQRTLAVDVELPYQPMQHAGLLKPGGGALPISREQLEGGLRITDCGLGDVPMNVVKAALDAADVTSALGKGPPYLWLPAQLAYDEPPPTAEEDAAWRSIFDVPDHQHLVRVISCSMVASEGSVLSKATNQAHAGDLYIGSAAFYFQPHHHAFQKKLARREKSLVVNYDAVISIVKKTSKLPNNKGLVLSLAAGSSPSSITLIGFTFASANQIRHLLETLVARCSTQFRRDMLTENVALRARFNLEHEQDLFVLQEYACALVHADGSARGKLYVTQRYLCFKGSLFGHETRATFSFDEILSIEPVETPTPNSIGLTCTTSEERLTFLNHRGHALLLLCQLHAVAHGAHLLPTPSDAYAIPSEEAELKPSPFLERAKPPPQPFANRPLRLNDNCNLIATCWRYPVKASLATGCPARMLIQAPAAIQNLLPEPLEWRVTWAKGEPPVLQEELPPRGALREVHSMVAGARYALQLRLPGYDWSAPIELDANGAQRGADRVEMVRLRPRRIERPQAMTQSNPGLSDGAAVSDEPSAAGTTGSLEDLNTREKSVRREKRQERRADKAVSAAATSLKLLVQHRSGCQCARHLLQVYATHWLINGTGLTLEFRVGRKKAHTQGRAGAVDTVEDAEAEAREVAEAAAGEVVDTGGNGDEGNVVAIEEQTMSDQQTLLESIANGSRHSLAVRVKPDVVMRQTALNDKPLRKDESDGGWSSPFSLLVGLGQLELGASAARSLRAGKYDLALHITPLANTDHGRIKVVTFVQRFWLYNRAGLVLECEQHNPKSSIHRSPGNAEHDVGEGEVSSGRDPLARKESFARGRARKKERVAALAQRSLEQREQRTLTPLAINERAPWHWPSPKEEPLLRVRAAPGQGESGFLPGLDEGWSSAFPIDTPGTFVVFCEQGVPRHESGWWASILRILVTVELVDARIEVTFELAPPAPPPILVVNQSRCIAAFWQRGVVTTSRHVAPPGGSAAFAWPEPQLEHAICISLSRSSDLLVTREPSGSNTRRTDPWRSQSHKVVVEAHPINLDAFDQPSPLVPSKSAKGGERDTAADSERLEDEYEEEERVEALRPETSRSLLKRSQRRSEKLEPVAWAHVALLDGVRVVTISETRPDTQSMSNASSSQPHLIMVVDVAAFGISIVHTAGGQEILYVSGTGLKHDVMLSADVATFELQLAVFQIDNQLSSATLPAVLSLAGSPPKEGRPALHLSIVRRLRTRGGAVDWWEYVSCRLLELELAAEPILVQALLDFLFAARIPSLIRLINDAKSQKLGAGSAIHHAAMDGRRTPPIQRIRKKREQRRLSASVRGLLRYGAPERLQYFKRLELHPIRVSITFHHNNNLGFGRGSAALLVPIPHIDEAPIHLSALLREHLVGTAAELGASIASHYKYSLLRQLMRVLLQVDMLGDPVGFVRTWSTGVKDLFYLPAMAVVQKPSSFGRAVAAGSASFAKSTIGAPINSFGKFVSSAARSSDRTLAAMDMGRTGGHWAEARESQRAVNLERGAVAAAKQSGRQLMDGTTKLGLGIISGVVGIVREPVKGAMNDGVRGFSIGVGKGIAGAALRPTAGVLHFASGMTNAMQQLSGETESTMTHSARIGRRRPPRMLHPISASHSSPRCRIVPYSLAEALAQQVLHSAGEGHYVNESMLRFELLRPPAQDAKPLVLVLTGVRLLVVDTTNWMSTANVPLRKVLTAEANDSNIVLILASRRGSGVSTRGDNPRLHSLHGDVAAEAWPSEQSEGSEYLVESGRSERAEKSSRRGNTDREKRLVVPCYSKVLALQLAESVQAAATVARTRRTAVFDDWRRSSMATANSTSIVSELSSSTSEYSLFGSLHQHASIANISAENSTSNLGVSEHKIQEEAEDWHE